MGHLINPISFRLGYSRNWRFSGALMESKSQYFYLNSKYYNLLTFFKRIFSLQVFEKMGVLFSHLRFISSFNSDVVIIYLYDGPFQNESFIFYKYLNRFRKLKKILRYSRRFFKKFMKRTFILFYYLRTLNLLYKLINKFLQQLINVKIVKFMYIIAILKSNLKIIDNIYFLKSFFFKYIKLNKFIIINLFLKKINNFFFSCFIFDYLANIFFKIEKFSAKKNFVISLLIKNVEFIFSQYLNYDVNFFIKIYNCFFDLEKFFFHFNNLFLFKYQKNGYLKNINEEYFDECSNIRDVKLFFNLNENFVQIIKKFSVYFIEIFIVQRSKFFEFCKKLLSLMEKGRKKKFIFLNFFFKFLNFFTTNFFIFLKNIIFLFKSYFLNSFSKKFLIYFKNISKKEITASLITKYICIRLKQKFSLKEVIRPILKDLVNNSAIQGFRLSCCGRFTKKEIATYRWERRGHVSLNSVDAFIDYSFNYVILKYSVCGIKIWLHKNSNYKYFFKKWFENFKYFYKKKKKGFNKNKFRYKKIRNLKKKQNFVYNKKIYKRRKNKKRNNINSFYNKLNNLLLKKTIRLFLKQ